MTTTIKDDFMQRIATEEAWKIYPSILDQLTTNSLRLKW